MKSQLLMSLILLAAGTSQYSHALSCVEILDGSVESLSRSKMMKEINQKLSEVLTRKSEISLFEIQTILDRHVNTMLDRGHDSWRTGYQNSLKNKERDPNEARFKELPKGVERDQLLKKIATMTDTEKADFLADNGYKISESNGVLKIEQNINQTPDKLFPPLHLKLNGVHKRYAQLISDFVLNKIKSGGKIKKSEITALSAQVHQIWMQDMAWKVQPVLAKFGVSEGLFYSLQPEDILKRCEQIVRSSDSSTLSSDEIAALDQFTSYYKLSKTDKTLDDQIIYDNVRLLNEELAKTLNRESAKSVLTRVYTQKQKGTLKQYDFVKDAPMLAYVITSGSFDDVPALIKNRLGELDKTKYDATYLAANIGGVFALQTKDDGSADFYIVSKTIYDLKYKTVDVSEVHTKNAKTFAKLAALLPELTSSADPRLIGALKTVPVKMVKMSELGYDIHQAVVIQSPWGSQTKPAGKDAYLTYDEPKKMYYMIQIDPGTNLPQSYVPPVIAAPVK